MEEAYKTDFLRRHEPYSEILVYDWSTGGDSDIVVEDIMKIGKDKRNIEISLPLHDNIVHCRYDQIQTI